MCIRDRTRFLDDVGIGGSFNTIIGVIFLVIVIVSPDGLMGFWGRLSGRLSSKGRGAPPAPEAAVEGIGRT